MKLEVGMYIRTNQGIIAKLIDKEIEEKGNVFIFDKILYSVEYDYDNTEHIKELTDFESYMSHQGTIDIITKSSFNLIDLIEVGDIVKMIVLSSNLDMKKGTPITNEVKDITYLQKLTDDKDLELKSILTHELFEANCYKVGE